MHFGVPWNQFVLEATRNKLKGVFWTGKRKPGSTARQNKLISECTAYDFKDELERKKISHWLKSVSAFANTEGGALFFGVSNNGTVTGLKDIQADSDFISEKINAHLVPVSRRSLRTPPNYVSTAKTSRRHSSQTPPPSSPRCIASSMARRMRISSVSLIRNPHQRRETLPKRLLLRTKTPHQRNLVLQLNQYSTFFQKTLT